MTTQTLIADIETVLKRIADSDSISIQMDLADDSFEPLNLDILGIMYSFVRAEVVGPHIENEHLHKEEYVEACMTVTRWDDETAGIEKEYQFTVSHEFLLKWRDKLRAYLFEGEAE